MESETTKISEETMTKEKEHERERVNLMSSYQNSQSHIEKLEEEKRGLEGICEEKEAKVVELSSQISLLVNKLSLMQQTFEHQLSEVARRGEEGRESSKSRMREVGVVLGQLARDLERTTSSHNHHPSSSSSFHPVSHQFHHPPPHSSSNHPPYFQYSK